MIALREVMNKSQLTACIRDCVKFIIAYYSLDRLARRIGDEVRKKEEDRKQIQGSRGIRKGAV